MLNKSTKSSWSSWGPDANVAHDAGKAGDGEEGFPQPQPTQQAQPPPPIQQQTQPPPAQQQTQPPPPAKTDDDGFKRQGRNRIVPEDAFKRIKQDAEARGARRAQEQLAKEMGYPSVEAMKAAMQHRAQPPPAQDDESYEDTSREQPQRQQQQQQTRSERRENGKWDRERERLLKEKEALARRMNMEARQRKELQRALDAKDAEMSLREIAVSKGIRDIDYAVRLLTRHLEGQDEKALEAFDEAKFFDDLRGTHPYLFGEVTRPATTGTGAGNAPPPPKPGGAAQAQSQGNQIDARKMSREEYQEHLRKRGLSVGM